MSKTNLASIEASFKRTAKIVKTGSKTERAGRFFVHTPKKQKNTSHQNHITVQSKG